MKTKKELNQNIHLSEGNIKSKCDDNTMFLTWSIPSRKTCPYATEMCKSKCFAKKRELNFAKILACRERNFEETLKDTFVDDMIEHLEYQLNRKKAQNKLIIVRIHTSGDFYNTNYFSKWVKIAQHFKGNENMLFQAYTKSMPILEEYMQENNLNTLKYINIHLVWSIWDDTPKKYTSKANELGLQTFTALPKEEIEKVKNEYFICNGDCGSCKECYTGTSKKIVIQYH